MICTPQPFTRNKPISPAFPQPSTAFRPFHRNPSTVVGAMGSRQLVNKQVIVVGASRGLGFQWTKQLLEKGNRVIATVRDPGKAQQLDQLAQANKDKLTITQLDIADPDDIKAWAKNVRGLTSHCDVLINNAGMFVAKFGPYGVADWSDFTKVTAESMLRVFCINSVGPLLTSQQLCLQKLLGPPGSIVANITSKMGSCADNTSGGTYPYRASKAALNIITESMSIDLKKDKIISVLLHPGWVKTDMTNHSGLITAEESVRGLISVLESDKPLNGHWYDYKHEEVPW